MISPFGWSLPPGCTMRDIEEAYGVTAPITAFRITQHRAIWKSHVCSECFTPINIGERYRCTVYKDEDSGKFSRYKTHLICPWEGEKL